LAKGFFPSGSEENRCNVGRVPGEALKSATERLLAAVRAGDHESAVREAEQSTELASAGLACAVVLGATASVTEALAERASSASEKDASGWGPLLYASASPFSDRADGIAACVELLLDHGADPNTHTLFDASDPASRLPALYFACVTDQPLVVRLLLERGAEPNDGESIYHAAELNRVECLEELVAHGADLSGRHAHWGNTPLYFLSGYLEDGPGAARAREGMRWLLEHGADPNVSSGSAEETPLHRVAERRGVEAVQLLLAHGAKVDQPRADGRTPYVLALRSGSDAVAELLLERGADPSRVAPVDAFLGACLRGDERAARDLLEPGLLEGLTEEERCALGWAAQLGREDSVRLMAALGFDLSWEAPGGGTPLHQAAWTGNTRMVRLLLDLGAPVNVRDGQFGSSPLGWAAHGSANCRRADEDYGEIVEALLGAAATREAATNRWNEPPEALASPAVAARLR
jgi:ankyrin repeat protein